MKRFTLSLSKGFTLIELTIAMGILVILLSLSVTVLTRFIGNERREIAERSLQEDIRFALELFMREARTSYASTYTTFNGGQSIFFVNQKGECVAYQLNNLGLERGTSAGACSGSPTFSNWEKITSNTTEVVSLMFQVPIGVTNNNVIQRQGFVTIVLGAKSKTSVIPTLKLETTITSRQVKAYGT